MAVFVIFGLAGIGTYALRIVMIVGAGRFTGADWLQRRVSLVSPAVLAAIVASALFVSSGELKLPNVVVLAAVTGGAYGVHRTGNVAASLAFGLPVYWLGALAGLV